MPKLCSVCGVTYSDALVFCPADGTTLRSADLKEDLVGSVIADRYLVTDILGEGGMGTVYLARHVRLPQQAAIKVLRKEMLQDASAVARFNREAANASRIDHDRVARVYDFGETDQGVVYLAMEFVPGQTLKKLLADGGPMTPLRAANVVRQIAEGLDAAHRMEIVHRDLKPDNVMVIRDGDAPDAEERVKVVDFGIAKAFGDSSGGTVLTRTGFVVGTPEFMSPEQLLGGTLDARSDIYALAIVAYQCLTAELPFATNTPDHGMAARLVTPPRPLTAVQPAVRWPQQVQSVLDSALSRDPADRPPSAGAFARALGAAIEAWQGGGSAAAATRATNVEWTSPAPNGGTTAPASAATRANAATAMGSYAPPVSTAAVGAAPADGALGSVPATSAPASRRMPVMAGVLGLALVAGGGIGWAVMRQRAPTVTPHDSVAVVTPPPSTGSGSTPTTGTGGTTTAGGDTKPADATPNAGTVPNGGAVKTPSAGATPRDTATHRPPNAQPNAQQNAEHAGTPPQQHGGAATASASAARAAIDSIAKTYNITDRSIPTDQAASAARQAVPVIRGLMTSLASDDDKVWANLKLSDAYLLLEQSRPACDAVREAKRLAGTPEQKRAVAGHESIACGE